MRFGRTPRAWPASVTLLMTCLVILPAAQGEPPAQKVQEQAQENDPSHRTIVTPSRGTTSVFDTDRVVLLLSEEDLEEVQAQDGPEAIATFPGVTLQRTNRGAGAPVMRGMIGPSNLILVDGVRLNLSTFRTGPNQYAALVDPMALGSIEVLLGPGSVLYGSDAMGGVIHYRTRNLPRREGLGGRAMTRFSSADLSSELAMDVEGKAGGLSAWAGGSIRRHDLLRTGGGAEIPRSDFLQGDWRAKARLRVGNRRDITAGYLATHVGDATRVDKIHQGDLRAYTNTDHLAYLTGRQRWLGDGLKRLEMTLSYHGALEVIERNTCHMSGGVESASALCLIDDLSVITRKRRYEDQVDALALSLLGAARWWGGRLHLLMGLDARHEEVASRLAEGHADGGFSMEAAPRGNFSHGSTFAAYDAYASVEGRPWVNPGESELVLRGGARASQIQAFAPDVPGLGDVSYTAQAPVFDAGARLLLANQIALFGNWSQGFRAPNLHETTGLGNTGTNFEIPNDDLGPERSTTMEVGARYMRGEVQLQAAWFVTDLEDAITRVDATWEGNEIHDGAPVKRRVNADSARYEGYELSLRSGRWRGLSAFGRLAAIEGTVLPIAKGAQEEPARRVPPLSGAAGLRWRAPGSSLELASWIEGASDQKKLSPGDQDDLRICEDPHNLGSSLGEACEGTRGWTTLNLSARMRPTADLSTALSVRNALDANYRLHGSGYDAPGLDVRLSAHLKF